MGFVPGVVVIPYVPEPVLLRTFSKQISGTVRQNTRTDHVAFVLLFLVVCRETPRSASPQVRLSHGVRRASPTQTCAVGLNASTVRHEETVVADVLGRPALAKRLSERAPRNAGKLLPVLPVWGQRPVLWSPSLLEVAVR